MARIIVLVVVAIGLAAAVLVASTHHKAGNIIPPLSANLKGWTWRQGYQSFDQTVSGGVTPDEGGVKIDTIQVDPNSAWKLSFFTMSVHIVEGHTYKLTFKTKAKDSFVYQVCAYTNPMEPSKPMSGAVLIGLNETVEAGPQWAEKTFTFTAKGTHNIPAQVPYFIVGTQVGTVWIKDIVLTEV